MIHIQAVGIERVTYANGALQLIGVIQHAEGGRIPFTWNIEGAETVGCLLLESGAFARAFEHQLREQEGKAIAFGDALPTLGQNLRKRMDLNEVGAHLKIEPDFD